MLRWQLQLRNLFLILFIIIWVYDVHVYMLTFMYMEVYTHMALHMWRLGQPWVSVFTFSLVWDSFFLVVYTAYTKLSGPWTSGDRPDSAFHVSVGIQWLQVHDHSQLFYLGLGVSNSGPHTCTGHSATSLALVFLFLILEFLVWLWKFQTDIIIT